jgi:hypothetical protein
LIPPLAPCFPDMLQLAIFVRCSWFLAYVVELVLLVCYIVSIFMFYIFEKFDYDVILRWYCLICRRLGITRRDQGKVELGRGRATEDILWPAR